MSKPNRNKCIVCGKEYDVCLSCRDVKSYRPWRSVCDTIEHYKIHMVLSSHANGFISSEEAEKELSTFNYNADELLEPLKEHIDNIKKDAQKMGETEKPKRGRKSAKNCE